MAEKDTVIKEKVKYDGIFDFKELYKYAFEWLLNEKYDVIEDKYSEKVSGNSKELEIIWTSTRKISDYFKIELTTKWFTPTMTDVEVEIDGKKKKMNKTAGFEIVTKGILIKDYRSTWESSPLYNFFRNVYNKYIIPARIEQREMQIITDVQAFNAELKAFINLTGMRPINKI